MAGFRKSGGTDLDSVFAPYTSGTKPALTGFRNSAGTDLRDLYAPIATGSAAAATGYRISSGADLNTLFAAAGTVSQVQLTGEGSWYAASVVNPVSVQVQLTSAGQEKVVTSGSGGGANFTGTWLLSGTASDYEVLATLLGGSSPSPSSGVGSWLNLGTNRAWSWVDNTSGGTYKSALFKLEIRRVGTTTILDSATYDIYAEYGSL